MKAKIKCVVNGKCYDTKNSYLIASDEWWDGSTLERDGRNTHLYRTKQGEYFVVYSSTLEGESLMLESLTHEEAAELYQKLPVWKRLLVAHPSK